MALCQSCVRHMAISIVCLSLFFLLINLNVVLANSMAPEIKRFMGMLPGYVGHSSAQGHATTQPTPVPVRPGHPSQSMLPRASFMSDYNSQFLTLSLSAGNDARNAALWAPRSAFNRPADSAADARPTVSGRTDVVMGENVGRRGGELPIPTVPSPNSMDVSSPGGLHAAGSRQSPSDGNVPSSRSSNHDDASCPFLHGWQRHNRLVQVSSPLVQEMSPGTREYLRKNATTIFLHWMRDANFLDDLIDCSARSSSPSSSSSLSS